MLSEMRCRHRDDERERISGELHDFALQQLIAGAMNLQQARQVLDRDPRLARERLEVSGDMLQSAVESMQRVMMGMAPVELGYLPFEVSLERSLRAIGLAYAVALDIHVDVAGPVDGPLELAVLRILCEATTNAAKHAAASVIGVRLVIDDGMLLGEVRDDGKGFSFHDSPARSGAGGLGMGLSLCADRVRGLGGRITLETALGAGSLLAFVLPLDGSVDRSSC